LLKLKFTKFAIRFIKFAIQFTKIKIQVTILKMDFLRNEYDNFFRINFLSIPFLQQKIRIRGGKMKNIKKVLALLMAFVLCFSILSGCSSGKTENSNAETKTEEFTPTQEGKDPFGDGFTGYPIKAENATLRLWTQV